MNKESGEEVRSQNNDSQDYGISQYNVAKR